MKLSSSSFVLLSFLVACSSDTTKKPASESDLAARNETGCSELVQPPPDFCDGGAYSPTYSGQCIVGFACSDDVAECPELVQPPPSFCDGGKYSPTYSGQCIVGFACSDDVAECPELVQPPPDFCDGGKYSPTYEGKCIVGFTCGS